MDEQIIRVLEGRARSGEEERVRAWRRESAGNEALYRDLEHIWLDLTEAEIETTPPSIASIRARAESPVVVPIRSRMPRRSRLWIPAFAAAAMIALVLQTSDFPHRESTSASPGLQIQRLATGASETSMTQLSDGTLVYLAPNSSVQVTATPGIREVWLEGRAFFGVAKHGDGLPFLVRSRHGTVHVLGTRFEFSAEDQDVRVVVVDGRVDFAADRDSVQLGRGQMSVVSDAGQPVVLDVPDLNETLGWMSGALVFEDTPLPQAAREIEVRFGAVVQLDGDDLSRQRISGGFKVRTFAEVVSTICRVLVVECSIEDGHAVISSRPTIRSTTQPVISDN